jgi:hypothetical protein
MIDVLFGARTRANQAVERESKHSQTLRISVTSVLKPLLRIRRTELEASEDVKKAPLDSSLPA